MKKLNFWIIGILFLAFSSLAEADSLCRNNWANFQSKLLNNANRLSFTNSGGPMGIGLCWWHSRMQRNANYLLAFDPLAYPMKQKEIWTVIKGLSKVNKVQTVRGYQNLEEFSLAHADKMNETLGQWQAADSFFRFNWVNGLSGSSEVKAKELKKQMDALYTRVNRKKEIVYQMLQMPGAEAHAWLVIGMKKTSDGYALEVVDSNTTSLTKFYYTNGMSNFSYYGKDFVPFTQREDDFKSYFKAINSSCAAAGTRSALESRR